MNNEAKKPAGCFAVIGGLIGYILGFIFLFGFIMSFTEPTMNEKLSDLCLGFMGILVFPLSNNWIKKQVFQNAHPLLYGAVKSVLIILLFWSFGTLQPQPTPEQIAAEQKQLEVEKKTSFIAFEKQILATPSTCDNMYKIAVESTKYGDVIKSYQSFENAELQCGSDSLNFNSIKVPEKLTEEQRKKLEEAKSLMSDAYINKALASKSFKKALNGDYIANMSEAERYGNLSQSQLISGIAKYMEVKQELGITTK